MIKLTDLKPNDANPRTIKDKKFKQLVNSIRDFPKMMALRPMVVNGQGVILGGNMRYRACIAAGFKEVPDEWVRYAAGLTDEEQARFIIEDNVSFGEWDFDLLANTWDADKLADYGVDFPAFNVGDAAHLGGVNEEGGEAVKTKDGNYFIIDFFGEADIYNDLVEKLEGIEAMEGKHGIKPDLLIEMLKAYCAMMNAQ